MSHASTAARLVAREDEPVAAPAISMIFRDHCGFVCRCLRQLGVPEAAVEDVAQEVFAVVVRRLPAYDERGSIRSWLFSITRSLASRHHRAQRRRGRALATFEHAPRATTRVGDPSEESVALREDAEALRGFLDGLPEDQRLPLVLAELEGMTGQEIATALDANLNTIYSRLRAAHEKLDQFVVRRRAKHGRHGG